MARWLVLVGGGRAAGKKTVCRDITEALKDRTGDNRSIVTRTVDMEDYRIVGKSGPEAYDMSRIRSDLDPEHSILDKKDQGDHCIVLLQGLYALHDAQLRHNAVMKVFVDSDGDTRLARWVLKDPKVEKLASVLEDYLQNSRPEYLKYVLSTKDFADVILPRGSEESGVGLIATGIYERTQEDVDGPAESKSRGIDLRRESVMAQNEQYYDLT